MTPRVITEDTISNLEIKNRFFVVQHSTWNEEETDQEKLNDADIAKGIVRFLVDIYDETGETVGIATILTMVKKRDQG